METHLLKLQLTNHLKACHIVEMSTGHITREDSILLTKHAGDKSVSHPQTIMSHEYGHIVSTWHNFADNPEDFADKLRKLGHTEAYISLLRNVHETGAKWMNIDCDADMYDFLPQFTW